MEIFLEAVRQGVLQLKDFLGEFLLGAFLPSFLIAGAMKVFIRERSITRLLGPDVNRFISYSVASVTGLMFTACSCGIIPLFASIFRHGAGIGPAMVFLTIGPAINFLAIIINYQVFGVRMTLYRTFFAIIHGFIVGVVFTWIYKNEDRETMARQGVNLVKNELITDKTYDSIKDEELDEAYIAKPARVTFWLFFQMILMLVITQLKIDIWTRLYLYAANILLLVIYIRKFYTREECCDWLETCGHFMYKILKPLTIGLFFIGFAKPFLTKTVILSFVGQNDLRSCTISSIIGAFMYFGSCVAPVIVKFFVDFGMADGPALSLFLAGPTLSFPSMLALISVMGYKKTILFALIIIVLSALAGLTY